MVLAASLISCSNDGPDPQELKDCERETTEAPIPGAPTASQVHDYCLCLLDVTLPDALRDGTRDPGDADEPEVRAFEAASRRCQDELR